MTDKSIAYAEAPIFSRILSMSTALDALHELDKEDKVIVEIGCIRNPDFIISDGNSSELFAWYTQKYGGRFYSVDIDPIAVGYCTSKINKYNTNYNIFPVVKDGHKFLSEFKQNIDLLYLDGLDYNEQPLYSQTWHMEAFYLIKNKLVENSILVIDDVLDPNTYEGKGKLLIPYLLASPEWKCLFKGYQFVFQRLGLVDHMGRKIP